MKTVILAVVLALATVSTNIAATPDHNTQSNSAFGDRVITNIVDGGGWKTSITLVNLSNKTAFVNVKFYGDNGAPKSFDGFPDGPEVRQLIPANGSLLLETAGTVDSFVQTGWGLLTSESSGDIGAVVVVASPDGQEPTALAESYLNRQILLSFDNTNGRATTFVLINTGTYGERLVNLRATDVSGTVIALDSFNAFLLKPLQRITVQMSLWPALASTRGTLWFTTDSYAIAATAFKVSASGAVSVVPLLESYQK